MTLQEKANLAAEVAREAGNFIRSNRQFNIHRKSEHDFVTEMDVASEKLIRERLLTACPEDEFFGEEGGGATNAKGRWIVDPIDGTGNYIKDIPLYAISIAYEYEGKLVIGCVYAPALDEMYLAVRGHGATCNGQPIHVSGETDPNASYFSMSFAARIPSAYKQMVDTIERMIGSCADMRRMGSAAIDLCFTAIGRVEGFFELGLFIYDIAAGIVILEEAGGKVTGWYENENVLETGNICATNGHVHEYLLGKLRG